MKSLGISDPESDAYQFDIDQLKELIDKRQINIDSYKEAMEKTFSEREDDVIRRAIKGERDQIEQEQQIVVYLTKNRAEYLERKYGQ